jgi:hypothetical protein
MTISPFSGVKIRNYQSGGWNRCWRNKRWFAMADGLSIALHVLYALRWFIVGSCTFSCVKIKCVKCCHGCQWMYKYHYIILDALSWFPRRNEDRAFVKSYRSNGVSVTAIPFPLSGVTNYLAYRLSLPNHNKLWSLFRLYHWIFRLAVMNFPWYVAFFPHHASWFLIIAEESSSRTSIQ